MRLENERKEKKRCRDRLRYHEKKSQKNAEKSTLSSELQKEVSSENFDLSKILPSDVPSTRSGLKRQNEQNCDERPICKSKKSCRRKKKCNTVDTKERKREYEREKKRKQRAKIYADPDLHAEFLEKKKKSNEAYKEKRKKISQMKKKDQVNQREKWKNAKRQQREAKKLQKNKDLIDDCTVSQKSNMKIAGARRARKNRKSLQTSIKQLEEDKQKLNEKNTSLKRIINKYKKRVQRLKISQKDNRSPSPNTRSLETIKKGPKSIKDELQFSYTLQKQVKSNYNAADSREKTTIARILSGKIIKKYQCMKKLTPLIISTQRLRANADTPRFILKKQNRTSKKIMLLKEQIQQFFFDDEVTTQSPNKKDCITYKKEKKLKRYLNDTLSNLHKQFLKRFNQNISFPTFLKYKPFFVVYLKINARNTCACVKHLNMQLKLDKLKELKIVESNNLSETMSRLTCNNERLEECMLGLCLDCKKKRLHTLHYDPDLTTYYYKWSRTEEERINKKGEKYTFKAMTKKKITVTQGNLVSITNNEIDKFLNHLFNIHNQYQYNQNIKKNLDHETVVLHSDFSENYATKCHTEVQSLHYGGSRSLLTLHTNAYYVLCPESNTVDIVKFCTISEDVRHTAPAVFAHLKPLFKKFQELGIKNLFIFTDGPTAQYRNKTVFALICIFAEKYGFKTVVWNFWESGHGKGIIDGLGGTLKLKADNKVAQGFDISNASTFINAVKDVKIDVSEIKSEHIDEVQSMIPINLFPAKDTFQVHQILWKSEESNILYLRKRSCNHVNSFTSCVLCDLKSPKFCPTEKVKTKKTSKKDLLIKSKNKSELAPSKNSKNIMKNSSGVKTQNKASSSRSKKITTVSKPKAQMPSENTWIAINEEGTDWYLGKIKAEEEICGKKIFIVYNIMNRVVCQKGKYFKMSENQNNEKKIFEEDIVCKIDSPKELKRPKNVFSIKEFNKVVMLVEKLH